MKITRTSSLGLKTTSARTRWHRLFWVRCLHLTLAAVACLDRVTSNQGFRARINSYMFLHLIIISRSGGVIYQKELSSAAPHLPINKGLYMGSTFHGLHSIAAQVAPLASSGIEKLECDNLKLQCFQTRTGVKFVLTAEPGTPDLDNVLHGIYELYSDYVLKNPFYEMDMPIRSDLFDAGIEKLVERNTKELRKARSTATDN